MNQVRKKICDYTLLKSSVFVIRREKIITKDTYPACEAEKTETLIRDTFWGRVRHMS